jgi:hypothetical protein
MQCLCANKQNYNSSDDSGRLSELFAVPNFSLQVQLQGHLQGQLQDVHRLIHDWTLKQDDFQALGSFRILDTTFLNKQRIYD